MVWDLRLHSDPGGPTSIADRARVVLATFYIVIPSLSGHTPPLGLFGLMFDRIVGRRVACATAAGFVDKIADEIELEGVKRA